LSFWFPESVDSADSLVKERRRVVLIGY
jgi:hypothetical protein